MNKKYLLPILSLLLIFYEIYGTDVKGGTHVTLPTFTTKTGAAITASAVGGWSMKTAEVDNLDSWSVPSISGNSARTIYISTSTSKFNVAMRGDLIPPNGVGSNGQPDFSIRANFVGELYIEPSNINMAFGGTAKALTSKINDVKCNSNWSIKRLDSTNTNWTGSSIGDKASITIGKNGDWNLPVGKYNVSAMKAQEPLYKAQTAVTIVGGEFREEAVRHLYGFDDYSEWNKGPSDYYGSRTGSCTLPYASIKSGYMGAVQLVLFPSTFSETVNIPPVNGLVLSPKTVTGNINNVFFYSPEEVTLTAKLDDDIIAKLLVIPYRQINKKLLVVLVHDDTTGNDIALPKSISSKVINKVYSQIHYEEVFILISSKKPDRKLLFSCLMMTLLLRICLRNKSFTF